MTFDIFDEVFYLNNNQDVRSAVAAGAIGSGLEHFQRSGIFEGRVLVSSLWNEGQYLTANPDVRNAVATGALRSGLQHFISNGERERRPGAPIVPQIAGFNEPFYLSRHPDVAAALASGQFTSGRSHFIRQGQLQTRLALFSGTAGDDIIGSTGEQSGVVGVDVEVIAGRGAPDPRPTSLGAGEVDLLTGGTGSDSFILGFGRSGANPNPVRLYLGGGDNDFAYIKNFQRSTDFIQLAGRPGDYTTSNNPITVGGTQRQSVSIFFGGDRVAVVEGVSALQLNLEDTNQGIFFLT